MNLTGSQSLISDWVGNLRSLVWSSMLMSTMLRLPLDLLDFLSSSSVAASSPVVPSPRNAKVGASRVPPHADDLGEEDRIVPDGGVLRLKTLLVADEDEVSCCAPANLVFPVSRLRLLSK
eukprot:9336532-Pyramimonas_sp.AAC.1